MSRFELVYTGENHQREYYEITIVSTGGHKVMRAHSVDIHNWINELDKYIINMTPMCKWSRKLGTLGYLLDCDYQYAADEIATKHQIKHYASNGARSHVTVRYNDN